MSQQSKARCFFVTVVIGVSAVGCGESQSVPGNGGLYSAKTIPVQVVIAEKDQTPVAFPSLPLNCIPVSAVQEVLRATEKQYKEELESLRRNLRQVVDALSDANRRLEVAQESVAKDYRDSAPAETDPQFTSRNPLEALSSARAAKSRVDRDYSESIDVRIAPIEAEIAKLNESERAVRASIQGVIASRGDRFFAALQTCPAKQWKTDANGLATLNVTLEEPWFIWAAQSREVATTVVMNRSSSTSATFRAGGHQTRLYRWWLCLPDGLDGAGKLSLDNKNLFDVVGPPKSAVGPTPPSEIIRRD